MAIFPYRHNYVITLPKCSTLPLLRVRLISFLASITSLLEAIIMQQ